MADKEFCSNCNSSHEPGKCKGLIEEKLHKLDVIDPDRLRSGFLVLDRAVREAEKADEMSAHPPCVGYPQYEPKQITPEEMVVIRADRATRHLMLTAFQIIKARNGGNIAVAIAEAAAMTRAAHAEGEALAKAHPEWFEFYHHDGMIGVDRPILDGPY